MCALRTTLCGALLHTVGVVEHARQLPHNLFFCRQMQASSISGLFEWMDEWMVVASFCLFLWQIVPFPTQFICKHLQRVASAPKMHRHRAKQCYGTEIRSM